MARPGMKQARPLARVLLEALNGSRKPDGDATKLDSLLGVLGANPAKASTKTLPGSGNEYLAKWKERFAKKPGPEPKPDAPRYKVEVVHGAGEIMAVPGPLQAAVKVSKHVGNRIEPLKGVAVEFHADEGSDIGGAEKTQTNEKGIAVITWTLKEPGVRQLSFTAANLESSITALLLPQER